MHDVRSIDNTNTFKKKLKTFLFIQSFMTLILFSYISFYMLTCLHVRTGQLSAV